MAINVHMRFESDEQRDAVLERLEALGTLPDGEMVSDDEGDRLRLDQAADDRAALARATILLRGALDGSDWDPAGVALSLEEGWV